jgi:hypothetical protein
VTAAIEAGVAAPAFSAALAYFDSYRTERLPANLLQAQRDYFGAHTYERVDKPPASSSTPSGLAEAPFRFAEISAPPRGRRAFFCVIHISP